MSNSVANQTWNMINTVNSSVRHSQTTQKQGEALIAEENRVIDIQQLDKDVIVPADLHAGQAQYKQSVGASNKPQLPYPENEWNAFQDGDDDQPGLISIIGTVLALQAKTNSNFWSTMWKQASMSMMTQVKFAPIIAEAIIDQYDAQSNATDAQASQAMFSGITNLGAFVMTLGLAYNIPDAVDTPTNPEGPPVEAQTEGPAPDESAPGTEDAALEEQADGITNKTDPTGSQRLDATKDEAGAVMKRGGTWMGKYTQKFLQVVQGTAMMSQASTGFSDSHYQGVQAAQQKIEGQAAAVSKESEQYAQFFGQDFSRDEDLRQGSGQNIDYAMNILQQAANTITQTVTSMFRG